MSLCRAFLKQAINLNSSNTNNLRAVAGITPFRNENSFSTYKSNEFKVIKKPNTAYTIYFIEKQKQLAEQNKKAKFPVLASLLADKWKKLDLNDKKVYYEKSDEESRKYKETFNKMTENEFYEYLQKEREYMVSRRKDLARLRDKKERTALNEPKQPSTAFGLYVHTLNKGNASPQEFLKSAAEKWKQLAVEEKEKFRNEYKEKAATYEKQKFAWESEMILKGKGNFVRKRTWRKLKKIFLPKM